MNAGSGDRSGARLSRRAFLYVVGAIGAGVAIGGGLALRRYRDSRSPAPFLALLDDLEGASKLGSAWVDQHPRESDPATLVAALRRDLDLESGSVPARELRRRVAERIRSEYSAGHMGKIGNWSLSNTEIHLCALAAVTRPGATDSPG